MTAVAAFQHAVQRARRRIAAWTPIRVVGRGAYDIVFEHGLTHNGCRGVYDSFEEAARAAPSTRLLGYDQPGFGEYYREHLEAPRPTDYPVLFWLRTLMPEVRRVFDFGGHVGIAYYAFRRHLAYRADLQWTVCDVPSTVRAGEALARTRGAGHLAFTSSPAVGDGSDVLHASGSLQYLDDGFLVSTLRSYRERPRHVFVNLTPLHDRRRFFTVQCTGVAYHPYTIAHRGALVADMASLGYELVDRWDCPRKFEIPYHEGYELDAYAGLYFRSSRG